MTSIRVKLRKSDRGGCKSALFIQLINKREVRIIKTGFRLYAHEWDNVHEQVQYDRTNKLRMQYLKEAQSNVSAEVTRLKDIIRSLEEKGLDSFEEIMHCFEHHTLSANLFSYIDYTCSQMRIMKQNKSAAILDTVKRSFAAFLQENDIHLSLVDAAMIRQYESYLQMKKLSPNSTSCYMRALRSVYNKAVEEGLSPQRIPFKKVYTGVAKTGKRSVDEVVIQRLQRFDLSRYPHLAFARDMFMFSFYTRGMSFVDMANLTLENIQDGYIHYGRSKTGTQLSIKIESCIEDIIRRYRYAVADPYILPIIHSDMHDYSNRLRTHNKRLMRISLLMGLDNHISSYTARHSWATIAMRRGVSIRIISESLGHSNEKTTRIYLASIGQNILDKANARVIKRFY